jgi:hypothetical protein
MAEEESIGQHLRKLREEKGHSLDEAAQATKIKVENLQAIESDEIIGHVPAVYAKALVRIYSEFLRADTAAVVERFKKLHGGLAPAVATPPPAPLPTTSGARIFKRVPRPVIFGGLAVVVAILFWCVFLFRSSPYKLTVKAIGRVPIKVYRDGKFVEGSTIEPGTTRTWRAKKRLELKISRPENSEVIHKGKKVSLPGTEAVSVVLDRSGIRKAVVSPGRGK